ncbi:uncharacterized protein LOC142328288 [Lycorma delicatula]|uniref:uncharacterized protein LOC142328288 n=1 Tax=Lycorma delicatula TaxID=130591 RepID=UPI003F5182DE
MRYPTDKWKQSVRHVTEEEKKINFQYNGQIDEDFDEYDDDDEKNNIIDDDNYNEDIENDEISDYKYGERYLRKADKSTDISNNDDNFDLLPKHLPPLNFTELQLEAFTQFITNLVTAHMKQLEHEFSSMSNENDFKNESNNTLLNQTLKKLMSGNQNNAKEDSVINDIDMNNLTERDINENDHSRDEVRNPRNTMDETTNNPEGDYENNSQWYSHGANYGNTVPNQHFKLLTPSNQQQKNMDRIISQNELNTDMQLSNNNDDYIRTDNSKSNKDKLTYKRENIIASKNTPYLINEIGSTSQTENKNDLASGLYSNRVSTPLFIDEKEKDMISKEANLNFDETIEREVINNYKSDSRTAKENLSNDKYELKKGENKGKEEATKTIIKDENFDDVHTKTNKYDTCSCNLSHSTEIFSRKCCNKNKSDSPELYNKVVNLPDDKINYDNRQIRQDVNQALISEKQNNGIKNGKRIVDHEKEFENRSKNSEKYKTTQAEENIKKSNAEKSRNKEDNMKHKQINNEDENLKKNIKVQLADNIEKYEKSEKNQFSAEKQGKVNENVKKRENNEKEQINQDQSLIYNEQQIKNKTIKKGTDVKNGTKQKELYEQNDKSQNRNINNPEENEIRKHQISNVNRNEKVDNKVQSLKNQEANFALTNDEKNENLIKKWRQIEDNQFKLTKGKNNKLTKNKIKNGNQRKNTANEKLIKDDNEDNEYRMNNENDYFNINNEDYYDDDFKNDYDDDSWEKKKEAEDYYYVDEEDEKQSKKNEEVEDEDEPEQEQEDNLDEDYNEDEDKSEKSKEYDNYRENNKITSESDEKESINGFQNEKIDHMNPDEAQETADYADDYYDDINVELEDQINDEAEEERRKREKIKMTSDETSAEINYENKRDETDNWVAGKGEEEQYSDYEEEEEENDLKEENEGENKENNEEREEEEEDSNESEQEESKENDLEEVEEQEESKESELVEDGEDEEKRENEGESTEEVSDEKESVKVEEKEENFEGKKVEENEITDSNKKSVRTDADWIFQESEPHTEQNRTAKSVQTRTMELNDNEVGNNKATHKKYENNISKHNKNINENEEYVKKSDVKKVILDILESKRPDIEKSKEMFYKGPENKYNELVKDIESYFAKKNVSVGDDICVYEEYGSKHGDSDLIYLCGTKLYQNGVPKKDAQNFNLIIKNPYHNDNKKSTYEILIDHKNNNNYSPIKHNKHSNEKEDNSLNDKNKRSIKGEMKFMHKKKRNSIHNNKHTKEKEHNSLHDKNKRSVKREMKFMLQKKRNSNQKVSRKTKRLK